MPFREPKSTEIRKIYNLHEVKLTACQHQRAEVILLYVEGANAVEVAQVLEVNFNTIYADLSVFNRHGLGSLQQLSSDFGQRAYSTPYLQRIRWKFCLFAIYDVDNGRSRWRYLASKGCEYLYRSCKRCGSSIQIKKCGLS